MLTFVIVLQVFVALFLIMVILLQPGNKGGASAALGGAGSDTVFGARGANTFLSKITFGAAVCFMVSSIVLSVISTPKGSKSVEQELEKTNASLPVKENTGEAAPSAADAKPQDEKPAAVEPKENEPAKPSDEAKAE